MDLVRRFVTAHKRIHDDGEALLDGKSDEEIRIHAAKSAESIAWRLWHAARVEDADFARRGGLEQVISHEAWLARLNVTPEDVEKGLQEAEAADLSQRIELKALREYWRAVGARTLNIISQLPVDDLDAPSGGRYVYHETIENGRPRRVASWLFRYLSGREDLPGDRTPRSCRAHETLDHLRRHLRQD